MNAIFSSLSFISVTKRKTKYSFYLQLKSELNKWMLYVTKGKYSSPQVYGINNHCHPSKKKSD